MPAFVRSPVLLALLRLEISNNPAGLGLPDVAVSVHWLSENIARAERCHMFRFLYVHIVWRVCKRTHACLSLVIAASSVSVPPSHVAFSQVCEMDSLACPSHTPQSSDNVRRIAKRVTGYRAILRTPEYYAAYCLWHQGRIASMPPEPDPYDMSISKRTWEASVQHWRNELRTLQNASPQ